ncbi:N-acylglucosamine 2-epimerase [Enemella evansiae]|uniref:thioredoxin domain-containing protein n=1 Tax=Enemella evansiae TaxID=2016499 RepID=UPI000B970E7B|nr:thioredoxin domain-containing protein [Enemella evansiae]OYO08113.1 N-acylglucosamine 2-epimerase [Enemella evansiae]
MPNRLAASTSPYLLQHADNPVDWWPWSAQALAEAVRREVPIFLSVGYAACHWCHVMAHESFEDPAVAELLNGNFVNIKVDREERPDIDAIYMNATTAMTGQGGWPMSVFLTPQGKPFYAGTYFPPRPAHGRPSFTQLVTAIADAWRDRREEVTASGDHIAGELARLTNRQPAQTSVDLLDVEEKALADFDEVHGGFGGAPKFPPTLLLDGLLAHDIDEAHDAAIQTLDAMTRGGIHDQLGGGFARYSVDSGWVVPHFEKMLYDNALLLGTLARAWGSDQRPRHARTVHRLVEWLFREMRTPQGAFAASLDADSLDANGRPTEGAFYVWNRDQLVEVLGSEDAEVAAAAYTVTDEGTFEDGFSTLQDIAGADPDRLEPIRQRLLAARDQRPRPARDDKVVAAWNGWLIDSLTTAAMIFAEPEWLAAAETAAQHLWDTHLVDGRLRRTSRDGRVGDAPAVLEDHAALALGFLRLAAATGSGEWLRRGEFLLGLIEEHFTAEDGGWYDTADDAEELFARPRELTDNVTPSGTSTAVIALRVLGRLTGEGKYAERADRARATLDPILTAAPRFAGWALLDHTSQEYGAPAEIAVIGDLPELLQQAWQVAPPGSVVVAGNPGDTQIPLLADRTTEGAYVCRDFICQRPVTEFSDLLLALRPPTRRE